MFVNCPHCQSLVAVDTVTGAAPEHCPYCDGAIGDAQVRTEEEATAAQEAGSAAHDASIADGADVPVGDAGASDDEVAHVPEDMPASGLPTHGNDAAQSLPPASSEARKRRKTGDPSFATRPAASHAPVHHARWAWPLAGVLLLALLLQLVLADRASLAASPRWRASMVTLCNALRCDLPPWREAGAFTMLARDVHAHPGIRGALRIRAAFRNDARWPQPWPQLVVTLSDAAGRVTGSRTFTADEYLGAAPTQKLIATGQTAAVAFEIREPAPDTVAFSFDFR